MGQAGDQANGGADAQTVTLRSPTLPSSGQPWVALINVLGRNFPSGTILPADITVTLTPAAGGTAVNTTAMAFKILSGSSGFVTFRIPISIKVKTATAYNVSISGMTTAGTAFVSGNTAALTVLPPGTITSVSPSSGAMGQSLSVTVTGKNITFVQGSTSASFGAGISVGGGAEGKFGPVTVTSATTLTAQLTIDPAAAAGSRTAQVKTQTQGALLPNGFTVTAAQPPTANPGGPYGAFTNQTISFDGTKSTDPNGETLTYSWTFGDGATGTGAMPTHAYTAANTYTVALTVTDTSGLSGTASTTATITVAGNPVANPGGPYSAFTNQTIGFDGTKSTDPNGQALTYSWGFGDGATGTGVTPTHAYTAANTYTVTLTVTDTSGLSGTASTTATITVPPPRR